MKSKRYLSLVLILLGALPALAQDLPKRIDNYMSTMTGESTPGAAVLVARDGKIIFSKGYGMANIAQGQAVTPETAFRIGSVSKQFTAAAIMRLMEAGKLKLDDTLSRFYPDFPKGDKVTFYHLLTHTSGIRSYTDEPEFMGAVTRRCNADSLIAKIAKKPYDFEPGTSWHYNNSAYFILGELIAKISEKSYADFLNDTFFKPLGMQHTDVYSRKNRPGIEATGYSQFSGNTEPALNWDMGWAGGAGVLYSTVGDLFLWTQALMDGRVLSSEWKEKAFTPATLNNGSKAETRLGGDYGFGWLMAETNGKKRIGHGGGLHGFLSDLNFFPDENVVVVVLTNISPTETLIPGRISAEIYASLFGEPPVPQAAKDIDDALLDKLAGQYQYPGNAVLTVTHENHKLYAQLSRQPKYQLFPASKTEWRWRIVDARIIFTLDALNTVTGARHFQNGQELEVNRLK